LEVIWIRTLRSGSDLSWRTSAPSESCQCCVIAKKPIAKKPKRSYVRDTDPRVFQDFSLQCRNCGCSEQSLGNIKCHVVHECQNREVNIYCGCCGNSFDNFGLLTAHLAYKGLSSVTVTKGSCKAIKFGEIMQNKGYVI